MREKIGTAAIALAKAVNYAGAGTVEFLLDGTGQFHFMEMNTRLQVEHPVTEMITGIDLVEWQLRVAAGERFALPQSRIRFRGHAIEARLCAEDADFLPQAGRITLWIPDASVRTDHALTSGVEISPFYDSMIAKVIAHGATRDEARARLARALDNTVALGVPTNKAFLAAVLRDPRFARGPTTAFLARFSVEPAVPNAATMAIAAALTAASAPFGEWNSWSNNPARAMPVKFDGSDIDLVRSHDAWRAATQDTAVVLSILSLDPPHARVAIDGAEEAVTFLIEDDTIHLARGGASHSLRNIVHAPARRAAVAGDGRLVAPMNGRVVAVNVRPGDSVEAGRALVVLEAMKMEHVLNVPVSSRVKAVHVAAGAQVSPGQLLLELEAS